MIFISFSWHLSIDMANYESVNCMRNYINFSHGVIYCKFILC